METDRLNIWTITANPADFPGQFVARRWEVTGGTQVATDEAIISPELADLRRAMMRRGLFCIPRSAEDDPVIVESWL